ncbi:MAG: MFS transporter [Candidatus Sericytochromatia bacterium]
MNEKIGTYESLKIKDFRYFLIARILLMVAFQIQSITVGVQIWEITKDPLALGFLGLSFVIPAIIVSLYAGYTADLYDRRKIKLYFGFALLILFTILYLLNEPFFQYYIGFSPIHVYVLMFFIGIVKGFINPASFGLMGQIIPEKLNKNAAIWGSSAFTTGLLLGPLIGGILYDIYGAKNTYFINIFILLSSLISIFMISKYPMPKIDKKPPILESISEGLKFVFNNQIIWSSISLDLFAVLFGGVVALLPVFASDILNINKTYLGILKMSPQLGAFLTSIILIYRPIGKNAGKYFIFSVGAFGLCTILFALSKIYWLSFILLFLTGVFDEVSVLVRSTIMQTMIPNEMRGRVSSVNSIFITASNELGEFESGLAAKLMGTVPSVIFGGFMTMFFVFITSLKAKKLRELEF